MTFRHVLHCDILKRIEFNGALEILFEGALAARDAGDLSGYFTRIAKIHDLNADHVSRGEYDPYIVDWTRIFTPIEEDAWFSIRQLGLQMFPQYTILNYFADFADPWKKLVLECDGKAWHDAAKDAARDQDMQEAGWTVCRIPGKFLVLGEDDPRSSHHIIRDMAGLPCQRVRQEA